MSFVKKNEQFNSRFRPQEAEEREMTGHRWSERIRVAYLKALI
jgi:hypothetical protein